MTGAVTEVRVGIQKMVRVRVRVLLPLVKTLRVSLASLSLPV